MIKQLSILVLCAFASSGLAQNVAAGDISIQNLNLREIVVSANKVTELKSGVAQQIETIDANQIKINNAPNTADLLQQSGLLSVQKSQQGGGSPVIRGFEASRIVLVVDGVTLNNILFRAGHLQNVITVDQNMLDRVDVLFGPSSTIYGSDALGGVIHMHTKNPMLSDGKTSISGNAFGRFASASQEGTGHVDINIGTSRFASLTSITYSRFGDLRMGEKINSSYGKSYGERPYYADRINDKDSLVKNSDPLVQKFSGYSQYDILQKFLFKSGDHFEHLINLQYSNSTDVPRYDRLTDPKGTGLNSAEWYYGPQKRLMGAYDLHGERLEGFFNEVHAGLNYQNIEESRNSRKFGSNNLDHRIEKVNVIGLSLDGRKVSGNHDLRIGLDGQFNFLKSTANRENISTGASEALDTRYPNGDNTMHKIAAYYTHTWKLADHWTLNDGIRLGYVTLHSTFENKDFFPFPYDEAKQNNFVWSANLGLIFTPAQDWKISVLGCTGFHAPNVDDLSKVFESGSGTLVVPNPDLKPEKTYNAELGITKWFGSNVRWNVTAYYTAFSDIIITDKFTFNGQDSVLYDGTLSEVLASQNKDKAYIVGFNSSLEADFASHWTVNGAVTLTQGRIVDEDGKEPLDHIPPMYGRVGLAYHNTKLRAELFTLFNGWKHLDDYYLNGEDNEQYATPDGMPSWWTLNLRASYQISHLLQIQAGVENILDLQYRTFSSGINAAGRNIYGTLRLSF